MAGLTFAVDDQLPGAYPASEEVVAGPPVVGSGSGSGSSGGGAVVAASAGPVVEVGSTTTAAAASASSTVATAGARSSGDQPTPTASGQDRAAPASTQAASVAPPAASASSVPVVTPTTRPPPALTRRPSVEDEVLSLTNRDRAADGKGSVSRDGCMDDRASSWARHMAETKTMSHSADAGPSVTGCRGASAAWADNVGNGEPCSAAEMQRWWMGSSGHRANLLGASYVAVGIGVWADATGHCWFQVYFGS